MVKAVVGANWGDEGKGKITDMLGKEADIIVRFQGGANAGHTIVNDYGKFALHTLPSGVFYDHTTSIIGNGVALDIPRLFGEVQQIVKQGVPQPKLLVSDITTFYLLVLTLFHRVSPAYIFTLDFTLGWWRLLGRLLQSLTYAHYLCVTDYIRYYSPRYYPINWWTSPIHPTLLPNYF